MSAPIQLYGPYRSARAARRSARVARWVLAILAGLLLSTPYIATAILALTEGVAPW